MKKWMWIYFLLLPLFYSCNSSGNVESMAKKQVTQTMKELAKNPESISIQNMKTVFLTDSICVVHFVFRGQNGFGGYSRENIEYMYCIQSSGDIYEALINLDENKSKLYEIEKSGSEIVLNSDGKLGMEDLTNWIKGGIGMYTMMQGRKIEK